MDGNRVWLLFLAASALCGCAQHDPLPFAQIAPAWNPEQEASEARSSAYGAYIRAADSLDRALGSKRDVLLRTNYSPHQRAELKGQARDALLCLREGSALPCTVPYAPPDTEASNKYRAEWRLLGRVLCWQIEDECANDKLDDAVQHEILITKLGFDLTGGSPTDATLGLVMVDSGRRAILRSIEHFDAARLRAMAEGVKKIYLDRPRIDRCARTAARDMLVQVQRVQDSYRDQDYRWIEQTLGDQAKEPIAYLSDLHEQTDQKRVQFFEGFADEARRAGTALQREADLPLRIRVAQEQPAPTGQRPWKRLARAFFDIGKPVLDMNDATCARTQLLILESEIRAGLKTRGQTPPDLSGFTKTLTVDPYSGDTFVYRTDGREFKLYSVGKNLVDDNGETDETFTTPDLMLEVGR